MATLDVDGLTFELIGTPAWSTEPELSYIDAAIRLLLKDWPFPEKDDYPHTITLELDDGRTFRGDHLWNRSPQPLAEDDGILVPFEGELVVQIV